MKYYKKYNPRVRLFRIDGQILPFEITDGAVAIAAYDEEKDKVNIEAAEMYIKTKTGGLVEITKEEYEELKKNLINKIQSPQSTRSPTKSIRLFDPTNPLSAMQSAPHATGLDSVQPAAAKENLALDVEGQDVSNTIAKVISKTKKVKIGKPQTDSQQTDG